MKRKAKILYTEWAFVVVYWMIVLYLYYIYAFWGTRDFLVDGVIKDYSGSWYIHLELILQATIFGMLFNIIEYFLNRTAVQKRSFGIIILVKSILYIAALFFAGTIVFLIFQLFSLMPIKNIALMEQVLSPRFFISLLIYLTVSIVFINFFLQVNRKFGPGNLLKMITGKYHKPRVENRIFMFLDLKDSTSIAERIGHRQYSQLLRACFHDLTDIIIKYRADIYQFVGDEVVLSWIPRQGLKTLNCIKTYFAFEKKLQDRRTYYKNTYQLYPQFRGGMDTGSVTVSEIGDLKREIAYHGDVLNTASRILDKCKIMDKKLLISEHLESNLKVLNGFSEEFIGEISLKGKQEQVKIYSIEYDHEDD